MRVAQAARVTQVDRRARRRVDWVGRDDFLATGWRADDRWAAHHNRLLFALPDARWAIRERGDPLDEILVQQADPLRGACRLGSKVDDGSIVRVTTQRTRAVLQRSAERPARVKVGTTSGAGGSKHKKGGVSVRLPPFVLQSLGTVPNGLR